MATQLIPSPASTWEAGQNASWVSQALKREKELKVWCGDPEGYV